MLVAGITYNKVERGVYALILQELNGTRRIPIVIGAAEAQSIECRLQEVITPRPLTHDLMVNIMRAFGLDLQHIVLKQIQGGIFATDLYLSDGEREVRMDSRSSDGIAIAIRMGVPIFVEEELLAKVSFSAADTHGSKASSSEASSPQHLPGTNDKDITLQRAQQMETKELQELLNTLVEEEKYELAAKIKEILDSRNS